MGEWTIQALDELAEIVTGATPKGSEPDSWGTHLDFVTPSDQRDDRREALPERRLSCIGVGRLSTRVVPAGSTCLTCIGSTIGKVSMTARETVTNQQINSLVARHDVSDHGFIYYMILNWSPALQLEASGSATPIVNKSLLGRYLFTVPDLKEQRAIAEVLGALDDKIAANDRLATTTKELLSTEFLHLGIDVEPAPTETVTLPEIITTNPKLPPPKSNPAVYLDMKNLPDTAMTPQDWGHREPKGGARFQNGDTLVARITPCLENGKTGFLDFLDGDEVGVGSTEYIVLRANDGIPTALPYFLATSGRFREFAIRHMSGTSGRQRLAATDLHGFKMRRPDPDALAEFGQLSDALMPRVKAAVDESRALAKTRDELLPLLMSGKIRVRDAERTVEEVV